MIRSCKIYEYEYRPIWCCVEHNSVQGLCIGNKKDGYRQQNVRQRQKLISIIDYDICILEYLQPFWRYSTSKNGLILKSGYGVLQDH